MGRMAFLSRRAVSLTAMSSSALAQGHTAKRRLSEEFKIALVAVLAFRLL